jgi:hypothetical protein
VSGTFQIVASISDHVKTRDTSSFVAWRYQNVIDLVSETLTRQDALVVKEDRTWQDLTSEIRKSIVDPKSSTAFKRLMSSIQPLPRSLATLNRAFISAVSPNEVHFNFLWGMIYLSLKVEKSPTEKLSD